MKDVEKWLPNCARNANRPIPARFAITTKKPNAPRRLPSMRLPNLVTSHQEKRMIDVRYDPEQSFRVTFLGNLRVQKVEFAPRKNLTA